MAISSGTSAVSLPLYLAGSARCPMTLTRRGARSAAGTYAVHLYIPDPDRVSNSACSDAVRANYAVRLAPKRNGMNVFAPSTGTNDLRVSLTVTDPT